MSAPQEKTFLVSGTFVFDGNAIVMAKDVEEARAKFDCGEFSFERSNARMENWEAHKIEETV